MVVMVLGGAVARRWERGGGSEQVRRGEADAAEFLLAIVTESAYGQ